MYYITIQIIAVAFKNVVRLGVIYFMVLEILVNYLAVTYDGQYEFHIDKWNPGHFCTSLPTRIGVL